MLVKYLRHIGCLKIFILQAPPQNGSVYFTVTPPTQLPDLTTMNTRPDIYCTSITAEGVRLSAPWTGRGV